MTTSGTINTVSTVRDLIGGALRIIGVSDNHEDAESYADALQQLQWMLKSMQADGVNLWRIEDISVTWPANQRYQTFGTDIITPSNVINIQDARVVISSTFERSLGRYEYGDYEVLPNKAAGWSPVVYWFDKRTDGARLYLWMVPTAVTTINLTIARVIEDVTDINQTVDLPQEWSEAIVYNLADRLLDPFSVSESQPHVAQRVTARAAQLYQKLLDMDRPASVFMKPWGNDR